MKVSKLRTAALAVALLGTGWYAMAQGDGAFAQDTAEPAVIAGSQIQDPVEPAAEPAPEVRFVAEPVVQEIPAETEQPAEPEAPVAGNSLNEVMANVPHDGDMSADMQCLAKAVYFESRGEPVAGQLAVATVIINRADSSRFPDTYCSVVKQRSQFSFVKGGRIPEPRSGAAWNRARKVARIAHRGLWESEVGDALYFHATYVKPRWASRMTRRAKISTHVFYR
ncbi:cell wall hydrolase [Paraurantiacibacter namhicola]|uniref:Spore cortex-lytic enzyme n=1 Tax=Paraurantiacibacter namhicola TaxID=645517 RepID=A0A1C7D5N3_9SPHN|nr:cell wall hydrolase [Paraurantiacibacter namhicola]ANU06765.1 Spore cortex-lytic enzyme precursor [Paraurantiacibacter namhicola]